MSREIIEKIKQIKNHNGQVNPDRDWVAQNRAQMMTQIKNTLPETKPKFNFDMIWQGIGIFVPNRIVYHVVRPVAVCALVAAVATSGWIASVSATQDSLPGELGYGVKRATEKTQLAVASMISSDDKEAQMHMELASKRAKEIKQVVKENKNNSNKNVQVAMIDLEKSIQVVEQKIKTVGESQPQKVLEVSKNVTEKTKEIKESLKEVEVSSPEVDVENIKKITNEVSLAAVEKVVQKKEEGKVEISEEEVKKLVNDQIEIINNEIGAVQQKAEVVVEKINNNQTNQTSIVNNSVVVADPVSSTENVAIVKEAVEITSKTVAINTEQTEKNLTTAKTLVESNQLMEAIQIVKEVTVTTQETAQVVNDTQKIVTSAQTNIEQQSVLTTTTVNVSTTGQ